MIHLKNWMNQITFLIRFNPITVEDLNDAQKDLKDKMEAQAIEKGILDIARENAETVISGMLSDYDVQIEWK